MYQPSEFRESDEAWALAHIRRHPFGVLFGRTGSGYAAAHLPFQLASLDSDDTPRDPETADAGDAGGAARDRELTLEGHGAVRNELLTGMPDGSEVLIVFSGPSAYITPGVYRAEPDVPTWNYTAVHVRGRYFRLPNEASPGLLERTVRHNERGPLGSGWSTSSMSHADLASLARGVASFRVEIDGIEIGRKLSQDKLEEDALAVEAHLAAQPGEARDVAAEMRETGLAGRSEPPSTDPAVWLGAEGESSRG